MYFRTRYLKEKTIMTLNQITSIKPNTESSTLITPTDYSGIQSQINQLQASLTSLQEKYDNLGSIVNTGTLNSGTIANSGAITTNSLTANSGDIGDIGYSSLTESTPDISEKLSGTIIPIAVCTNSYFGAHILFGTQSIDFIYNNGTVISQSSSGD